MYKKEVYWPRVIKIPKQEGKLNEEEKLQHEIEQYIHKVKPFEKQEMLYSVYLNNINYAKTIRQKQLLFSIIKAMNLIDRKHFVLPQMKDVCYNDIALPLCAGQTISQPTTVARMILLFEHEFSKQSLNKAKCEINSVLEVGTGSGWNIALIACIFDHLQKQKAKQNDRQKSKAGSKSFTSVEIIKEIAELAKSNIARIQKKLSKSKKQKQIAGALRKIKIINADAFDKNTSVWASNYDRIMFTAGIHNKQIEAKAKEMAKRLLNDGGIAICPHTYGPLKIWIKHNNKLFEETTADEYMFVPLVKV